jgi:hypothetical protein
MILIFILTTCSNISYAQIDPYVLARREFDNYELNNDKNIDNKRAIVIKTLLNRDYIFENRRYIPFSVSFIMKNGIKGVLGWGTSYNNSDNIRNTAPRENIYLYIKAPENTENIEFNIKDLPEKDISNTFNIRAFFENKMRFINSNNKLMVDLFNFSNTIGESGRFFQEFRNITNKTYNFKGNSVLFYDLDYSQQQIIEKLFIETVKEPYFTEMATNDHNFRKAIFFTEIREGILNKYIYENDNPQLKLGEIGSDKDLVYEIFEHNTENLFFDVNTKKDIAEIYETFFTKKQSTGITELSKEKALFSFIYETYTSNKTFFKKNLLIDNRINLFIDNFTKKIIENEMIGYLGVVDNFDEMEKEVINSLLLGESKLTEEEANLVLGTEYFPSGLVTLLDKKEDKNNTTSIKKLLNYRLLESGYEPIEIMEPELKINELLKSIIDDNGVIDTQTKSILFGEKDTLGNYKGGLYDYLLENSNNNTEYECLTILLGVLCETSGVNKDKRISDKVIDSFINMGILSVDRKLIDKNKMGINRLQNNIKIKLPEIVIVKYSNGIKSIIKK